MATNLDPALNDRLENVLVDTRSQSDLRVQTNVDIPTSDIIENTAELTFDLTAEGDNATVDITEASFDAPTGLNFSEALFVGTALTPTGTPSGTTATSAALDTRAFATGPNTDASLDVTGLTTANLSEIDATHAAVTRSDAGTLSSTLETDQTAAGPGGATDLVSEVTTSETTSTTDLDATSSEQSGTGARTASVTHSTSAEGASAIAETNGITFANSDLAEATLVSESVSQSDTGVQVALLTAESIAVGAGTGIAAIESDLVTTETLAAAAIASSAGLQTDTSDNTTTVDVQSTANGPNTFSNLSASTLVGDDFTEADFSSVAANESDQGGNLALLSGTTLALGTMSDSSMDGAVTVEAELTEASFDADTTRQSNTGNQQATTDFNTSAVGPNALVLADGILSVTDDEIENGAFTVAIAQANPSTASASIVNTSSPTAPGSSLTSNAVIAAAVITPTIFTDGGVGSGSLRDAITMANASAGDDHIQLSAGTYTLSLSGLLENANATGDLDILDNTGSLVIQGAGSDQTFIDAQGIDRIFEVLPGATLMLQDVTLLGGNTLGAGGAIQNAGNLEVLNSNIVDNRAIALAGFTPTGAEITVDIDRIIDLNSELQLDTSGGGGSSTTATSQNIQTSVSVDVSGALFADATPTTEFSDPTAIATEITDLAAFVATLLANPAIPDTLATEILVGIAAGTLDVSTLTTSMATAGALATGGGINNDGGTVTITNSTVEQNEVLAVASAAAGSLDADIARAEVVAKSLAAGGGVNTNGGSVAITDSQIANNQVTAVASGETVAGDGSPDDAIATGAVMASAIAVGGGLNNNDGAVTTSNTTLADNDSLAIVASAMGDIADDGTVGTRDISGVSLAAMGESAIANIENDAVASGEAGFASTVTSTLTTASQAAGEIANTVLTQTGADTNVFTLTLATLAEGDESAFQFDSTVAIPDNSFDVVTAEPVPADSAPATSDIALFNSHSETSEISSELEVLNTSITQLSDSTTFAVQSEIPLIDTNVAPLAVDDAVSTNEDTAFSGNVLSANPTIADIDLNGDTLTVTAVNGTTTDIGSEITLTSGALLTLNSDGTFNYDPNGAFESLNTSETDTDSFTYTIDDGNGGTDTATVTITITGLDESPLVKGQPATAFVDSTNTVVGNALQVGLTYAGDLFSNTDLVVNANNNPDDVILGTNGADNIWGGTDGSDIIDSGAGNDIIGFGDGDACVHAGDGNDFVYAAGAGAGTNDINLGAGTDTFFAIAGNHAITGTGNNTLGVGTGNDTVTTGAGDDFVYTVESGGGGTNVLDLGDGTNTVFVETGDYTITTGTGADIIGLGDGSDTVNAGNGNNIVYRIDASGTSDGVKDIVTGSGDDFVQTGSGNDLIDAGTGINSLVGGTGSDTFTFRTGAYNFIGDFEVGTDLIQLDGLIFEDLTFFQGAGDVAADVFLCVGSEAIGQVANTTVAQLNDSGNFV